MVTIDDAWPDFWREALGILGPGKIEEAWLLSWSDVFGVLGLALLCVGVPTILLIARKPRLFWPALLVVNIFGNGPRIKGYMILDEIFTGFIVLGAFVRIVVYCADRKVDRPNNAQRAIYMVWVGYMVVESLVGIVVNQDLRLVRWVGFYMLLGALSSVVHFRGSEFPFPSGRQTALIVVVTTTVYYVFYLAQGAIVETLLGVHGRFLTQEYYWSGSAYAVFPTLLATPAAIFLLSDPNRWVRIAAWTVLVQMMLIAFYFDSRISWAVLLGVMGVCWRYFRLRRAVPLVAGFLCLSAVYLGDLSVGLPRFFEELGTTAGALWAPGKSDVGRVLQLRAGINTAIADSTSFFFGAGVYSHRYRIVPYIQDLIHWYMPDQDFIMPGTRDDSGPETVIFRTSGFPALIVDTGVIGIGLLLLVVLFAARNVLMSETRTRTPLFAVLILALLWLLSNNILDIVMFHMLFMPRGLIEQWASANAGASAPNPAASSTRLAAVAAT